MSAVKVTLLVREGCHLCEEFEQTLVEEYGADAFEIARADVDSNPDWQRRYGLKIPVLLADDGSLVCASFVDFDAVRELLR